MGVASRAGHGAAAGVLGGIAGGLPSTVHALVTGADPLAATAAAGALLLPNARRRWLLAAAVPVHCGLSAGWGVVLAGVLPARRTVVCGAAAGVAIGVLDLAIARRLVRRGRYVRALPVLAQLADHAAYGAVTAALLRNRVSRADRSPG